MSLSTLFSKGIFQFLIELYHIKNIYLNRCFHDVNIPKYNKEVLYGKEKY